MENLNGTDHLGAGHRRKDNIKMITKKYGVNWIQLNEGMVEQEALAIIVN
jgi:hypothetical protein